MPAAIATDRDSRPAYFRSLAEAIRDPAELIASLDLPASFIDAARQTAFPLLVPRSFVARMRPGDPGDPLLRQVLPIGEELRAVAGFGTDAVGDLDARKAPGLIHKYEGRALLIAAGACAVHCRYCFRRHYPYQDDPRRLDDWEPALNAIASDESLREVILSGGDPLMLTDLRLSQLVARLEAIPHIRRLRIHTRLPIVLPDRVTPEMLTLFGSTRLATIVVVHANHPNELVGDCAEALRKLVHGRAGFSFDTECRTTSRTIVLNQAVLLRGVNDDAGVLAELSERLFELGVLPYYLHQLDRVSGTAHFEVTEEAGKAIMADLHRRLPGFLVPKYVRETPGEPGKTPIP